MPAQRAIILQGLPAEPKRPQSATLPKPASALRPSSAASGRPPRPQSARLNLRHEYLAHSDSGDEGDRSEEDNSGAGRSAAPAPLAPSSLAKPIPGTGMGCWGRPKTPVKAPQAKTPPADARPLSAASTAAPSSRSRPQSASTVTWSRRCTEGEGGWSRPSSAARPGGRASRPTSAALVSPAQSRPTSATGDAPHHQPKPPSGRPMSAAAGRPSSAAVTRQPRPASAKAELLTRPLATPDTADWQPKPGPELKLHPAHPLARRQQKEAQEKRERQEQLVHLALVRKMEEAQMKEHRKAQQDLWREINKEKALQEKMMQRMRGRSGASGIEQGAAERVIQSSRLASSSSSDSDDEQRATLGLLFDSRGFLHPGTPANWTARRCKASHNIAPGHPNTEKLRKSEQSANEKRALRNNKLITNSRIADLKHLQEDRDDHFPHFVKLVLHPTEECISDFEEACEYLESAHQHQAKVRCPDSRSAARARWIKAVGMIIRARHARWPGLEDEDGDETGLQTIRIGLPLSSEQQKTLGIVFKYYTTRVACPGQNESVMQRCTWFRFWHHTGLLSARGGVTLHQASSVFDLFAEQRTLPPTLSLAGWMAALQKILISRGSQSDENMVQELFGTLLKRCVELYGVKLVPEKNADEELRRAREAAIAQSLFSGRQGEYERVMEAFATSVSGDRDAAATEQGSASRGSQTGGYTKTAAVGVGVPPWACALAEEQLCEPEVMQCLHEYVVPLRCLFLYYARKDCGQHDHNALRRQTTDAVLNHMSPRTSRFQSLNSLASFEQIDDTDRFGRQGADWNDQACHSEVCYELGSSDEEQFEVKKQIEAVRVKSGTLSATRIVSSNQILSPMELGIGGGRKKNQERGATMAASFGGGLGSGDPSPSLGEDDDGFASTDSDSSPTSPQYMSGLDLRRRRSSIAPSAFSSMRQQRSPRTLPVSQTATAWTDGSCMRQRMPWQCFEMMLKELQLFPLLAQTYSLKQHLALSLLRRKTKELTYAAFVECLFRMGFVHLCTGGNAVQQTAPSQFRAYWLLALLRDRCRQNGDSVGLPEELAGTEEGEFGEVWEAKRIVPDMDAVLPEKLLLYRTMSSAYSFPPQLKRGIINTALDKSAREEYASSSPTAAAYLSSKFADEKRRRSN
eukprot:TRINITY_DN35742_c0_g1_i1.p1 TRINITY_DN35742_c0_g1~~TRINITY_DN35742_c0_g1_i1.p1  ORF type:complete len:1144 (+),score=242.65 TRINITY_DN35742_c0_g1_i1:185-3616(+)